MDARRFATIARRCNGHVGRRSAAATVDHDSERKAPWRTRNMGLLRWCATVCCVCRRHRRARHDSVLDGDIEMGVGGGQSKLVSERVRMLERSVHDDDEQGRPSNGGSDRYRTAGATVLERRAMLDRQYSRDKASSGVEPRRKSSAVLQRLRSQTTLTACGACGGSVYALEAESARGCTYHRSCLRCGSCSRSLVGVPFGRVSEDDDILYCDENALSCSGRSCLERIRNAGAHVNAEREAENQRLSEADRMSVGLAKVRAIDLIGDDMDNILQRMVPTCASCGRPFDAKDRLVMQGMVKFHETCCYGTTAPPRDVALTPKRALEEVPGDLLFKLKNTTKAAKVMTFFAVRCQSSAESAVAFFPDPASRAPKKRKVDAAALVGASVRLITKLGTELAPETLASFDSPDSLCARFSWRANSLDWSVHAFFSYDAGETSVAFESANLTVSVHADPKPDLPLDPLAARPLGTPFVAVTVGASPSLV